MEATASSSSSTAEGGTSTGDNSGSNYSDVLYSSPSHSGTVTGSKEEEEDMANCLILLAQSATQNPRKSSSELPTGITDNRAGVYAYQCKTCERCFPSFQALGGHRASHKKPKNNTEDHKKPLMTTAACLKEKEDVHHRHDQLINIVNKESCTDLSLQISSSTATVVSCINNNNNIKSSKVHECSICGAEFSSGQALGGHMRRHRPIPPVAAARISSPEEFHEGKKPRNLLSLDLNLPAPEDDHHQESKFTFPSKKKVIVFSASPLVDCHY